MLVLVSYDVSTKDGPGRARLRRVAKECLRYGQRVQNSVFECDVDPGQWAELKQGLIDRIDPEQDSLRFYQLGSNWQHRVEHVGAKPSVDLFHDPLLV
jgi:CRISPR-associated protein Cas2